MNNNEQKDYYPLNNMFNAYISSGEIENPEVQSFLIYKLNETNNKPFKRGSHFEKFLSEHLQNLILKRHDGKLFINEDYFYLLKEYQKRHVLDLFFEAVNYQSGEDDLHRLETIMISGRDPLADKTIVDGKIVPDTKWYLS